MIHLQQSDFNDLTIFTKIDSQPHAVNFIHAMSLSDHQIQFEDPSITYLSIFREDSPKKPMPNPVGYFVLAKEVENRAIEFRRIAVDQQQRGIGKLAIQSMEKYCQDNFDFKTIWLDVYEDNAIGIHIYQSLGYRRFDTKQMNNRQLHFYRKSL